MEPIGLTPSLLSLSGLFNDAVDSLEYIQLARNFGTTSQSSLMKLQAEHLRLSR